MNGVQLFEKFICLNTFIVAWEQKGLDNRDFTVVA